MRELADEGRCVTEEVTSRHHVSTDPAITVLSALVARPGSLGGMGQWSRGGMTMVGDMFNDALKARVDALCTELSALITACNPSPRRPVAEPAAGTAGVPGRSSA
jgi:hypothetical protein